MLVWRVERVMGDEVPWHSFGEQMRWAV